MKVQLQLKQSTHLALTPQLQQSIRLLQLSTLELEQEVETFLSSNPMLERVDATEEHDNALSATNESPEISAEAEGTVSADDWDFGEGLGTGGQDQGEEDVLPDRSVTPTTLHDHLFAQIRLMPLGERDMELLLVLIDNLDDDGYLRQPFEELVYLDATSLDRVETVEWSTALHLLQSMEPVGIGARNLSECLTLQILTSPLFENDRQLAVKLAQHLDILAQRDYLRLKRLLGVEESVVRRLHQRLLQLDPRPGAKFGRADVRYVVPDVLVQRKEGGWTVSLNPEVIPRLRINSLYSRLLGNGADSSLHSQVQEARWLIKNVQQRFDTILRVSRAVMERQTEFLEQGEIAMKPLVLREIADFLGLHESTISRVTSQKYLLTPRGLFELKYFFSSQVGTDSGEGASSTAIRAMIRQMIALEDSRNPLSDQRMADLLGEQGYKVARRTVAKYREAMHIQTASLRKSL